MIIGGLQKSSFIDYPAKICCVIFASGCNFNCPYCHNPDLVMKNHPNSSFCDELTIYDFLEKRKDLIDGVVISGGEPTLQKDFISLCEKIRQIGYQVKVDTNGSKPWIIKRIIDEGYIDYIAMDIKTDPFNYSLLMQEDCAPDNILSSIRTIMESAIPYEFRTTCVKPFVDAKIIWDIANIIEGARLYVLQRFNNRRVLHPEFFSKTDAGYDEADHFHLKSIAESLVRKCIIR